MAITKTTTDTEYKLPPGWEDNPYYMGEDELLKKRHRNALGQSANNPNAGDLNGYLANAPPDGPSGMLTPNNPPPPPDGPGGIRPEYQLPANPPTPPPVNPTGMPSVADQVARILGSQGGSTSDQIRAAAEASAEAQRIQTQQAIDNLNYNKELAGKARVDANRQADLVFSRSINPTGKLNQNIQSAGLAGSGWQETSEIGLSNEYQNNVNQNTSDFNTATKEINIAIGQAQQNGDIATLQLLQQYALQLAQQLYQESRAAVADSQWEKSFALQKAAFDLEQAGKSVSSSGGSFSMGGGVGGSAAKVTAAKPGLSDLFDADGNSVSGMSADQLRLYALNHDIYDEDGNPVDYERYQSTADSFKVDSSWGGDVLSGIQFEIEHNMTRNTTPQEAAQIVASTVYANAEYLSDEDIDAILSKYGMTQEQVIAILSGTGTGSYNNPGYDTSISDNDMAYWQLYGGK